MENRVGNIQSKNKTLIIFKPKLEYKKNTLINIKIFQPLHLI